jgi:hypothetical protein
MTTKCAWLLSAFAVAAAECGTEPYVCTQSVEPAIVVEIRDSVTGTPLADGARGVARDDTYADSLMPAAWDAQHEMTHRRAADERPGTYDVAIEHPGYLTWVQLSVEVRGGVCHVETVGLHALLQPSS